MSTIDVADVKKYLRVTHSLDDGLLQLLLDSAEEEAKRYCNREQLPTLPLDYPPAYDSSSSELPEDVPSSEDPIAPDVFSAVCMMVKADYEGVDADESAKLRAGFEIKLQPYRTGLGA